MTYEEAAETAEYAMSDISAPIEIAEMKEVGGIEAIDAEGFSRATLIPHEDGYEVQCGEAMLHADELPEALGHFIIFVRKEFS